MLTDIKTLFILINIIRIAISTGSGRRLSFDGSQR